MDTMIIIDDNPCN